MALEANYEFLVFGKDENSFIENYYYDLFQDYGDKSGQIFVNLEVQNNPADSEEIGKVIFETMQKVFFDDVEMDPYERFEITLKEINRVLLEFKDQKFSGYIGNMNVIIAAIVGNVLYLSQAGDAEAYMIRKRYVSVISEGLSDDGGKSGDVFTSIASGNIESGDFIMFSSTRLLRYITKTDLAKSIDRKNLVKTLENVKDSVSSEILGRVGFTGVLFKTASEDAIKSIEQDVDSATKTLLEADEDKIALRKESVTGKFFTALKSFRKAKKTEVFQGGGGTLEKVFDWVKTLWAGLFSKGFGKDKLLAVLVVVIVLLTVGIVWAKNSSATRAEIERLDEALESVAEKITEAETKGAYDKESAKVILDKAYEDAITVLNSGYYREKAQIYLMQIEGVRDGLDNVQRIDEPNVFIDLSKKRSDVNALGFVQVGERVFVFEYNALYELVLDQVQDPLTIDDEETVIAATGFDDRGSIVFMTKSGKLIEYRNGTMSFMDTDDGTFHKGVSLKDWSNRIYVLDDANGQIWKYTYKGTRETFGNAEPYIVEGQDIDLTNARDFDIDSNVYVLANNGDILKFYGGTKHDLYINDAPFNVFKDPTVLYTNEKLDEVYVLDGKESRILVFIKNEQTGNLDYKTQYLISGAGDLRDLYVDSEAGKMYVLTESKVIEVGL